jgi:single-strand DNA-binding protein
MNHVSLVGNLGQDPEMRYTASGTAVTKLSLATNRRFTGKDGQKQERTDWHRVTIWGKTAEVAAKYLSKGRQVAIEGRIEYGSYEKDGITHYTTDIICENMELLQGGNRNGGEEESGDYMEEPKVTLPDAGDIPF